jgi:hypothetical protein
LETYAEQKKLPKRSETVKERKPRAKKAELGAENLEDTEAIDNAALDGT